MNPYKILVVDDEESICEILELNLEAEGYDVDVAYSAEEAMRLDISQYSLLLLDIMMGEISGYKLLQYIRSNKSTAEIPVIFCSAKDSSDDTITGLNLGADDYISKPFLAREVVARVKSLLRRTYQRNNISTASESTPAPLELKIEFEDLVLDLNRKECFIAGKDIQMTKKEFEILLLFLQNRNVVFSRQDILTRVWDDEVVVVDRTIDVFITRIRKKIAPYGKHIVTRLGYGYGFYE
ncbi:MAG: response regulator transcription factor [Rikenellaceae bacterium]